MKNYLLALTLLISAQLFSQYGNMIGDSWYLESILSDGVTYERPGLHEAFSNSIFSEEKLFSTMCENGGIIVDLILDQTNSQITILDVSMENGSCTGESAEFRDSYYSFFDDLDATINYSIVESSYPYNTLTLEKNGDILTYKNHLNLPPEEPFSPTWGYWLERLTIDGVDITIPPYNGEMGTPFIQLGLLGDFEITVCNNSGSLFGIMDFYSEENLFIQEVSQTLLNCEIPENMDFEEKFTNFFWNNADKPFAYELTAPDVTMRDMLLTDMDGNEALFVFGWFRTNDLNKTEVQIYPNPVSDVLTVKTNQLKPINIKITDLTGKLVLTEKSAGANLQIDLSSLSTGIYIIATEIDGKTINSQKFIKK